MIINYTAKIKKFLKVLNNSVKAWDIDNLWQHGGALAFFTIFSLSQLLILILALSSLVFGDEAAKGILVEQIKNIVGINGAEFIQDVINSAYNSDFNLKITTFVSLSFLLVGATSVFVQLRDSLNVIFAVKLNEVRKVSFIHRQIKPFIMILVMGLLLPISIILKFDQVAIGNFLSQYFAFPREIVNVVGIVTSMIGFTLVFALIFTYVPDIKLHYKDALVGALLTNILFFMGQYFIGLYISINDMGSFFGASKSLFLFMVWIFLTSQIIFFGAEFTYFYAESFGVKITPDEDAVKLNKILKRERPFYLWRSFKTYIQRLLQKIYTQI
jgi:membrane protein